MITKQKIRNQFLDLRQTLSPDKYDQLNNGICQTFFSSTDLSQVNCLHLFLPIVSKKEVNTWLIVDRLRTEYPRVRISIPKVSDQHTLINYYFEDNAQVTENKWGIPEPQFGEIIPAEKIDLVLVPLLAFDLRGNRVGYGRGFYDRFLKQCRQDCRRVGLSFFDPVDSISDVDDFDVRLTHCVTPEKLFTF